MDRPVFDEVPRGYDPRQVDEYLAVMWRYAGEVTSRAAAAESALRHSPERQDAEARIAEGLAAQAGGRIGLMLAIAQREADDIIEGARQIAQSALNEAVQDAGARHPVALEAREQADKLLLDAVEESRRLARVRHQDLEAEIARCTASLESLRHQQGEIIGAVLRLRGLLGADEIDRAVADLARAGTASRASSADDPNRPEPRSSAPSSADRHRSEAYTAPPGPRPAPAPGYHHPPFPPPPPAHPSSGPASTGPASTGPGSGARRAPGRHRQQRDGTDPSLREVVDAEPMSGPIRMAPSGYRSAAEEDILDAEIEEE